MIQVKSIVFIADESQKESIDVKQYLLNKTLSDIINDQRDVVGKIIDLTWEENKLIATMEVEDSCLPDFSKIGYNLQDKFYERIGVIKTT